VATVLFVSPHQDDETLSMGASIRKHIEAGHDVHVLLLTNGVNSGARAKTGLDRPRFTAARDDEFARACRSLGVPFSNVHVSRHSTSDGGVTVQSVDDAVREFLNGRSDVWLKTYTNLNWSGRHADHQLSGQAAVSLLSSGVVTNLRLYVEPWMLAAFKAANPGVAVSAERPTNLAAVRSALDDYKEADHPGGRWGIGYLSVPAAFDTLYADPVSYYHVP